MTLRSVCGLTTPEIARAFLDSEATMGLRISRAYDRAITGASNPQDAAFLRQARAALPV